MARESSPGPFSFLGYSRPMRVLVAAVCLLLAVPAWAEMGDEMRARRFKFQKCRDEAVGKLVGMPREAALKRVRDMRLMQVRILDPGAPVNFEVMSERLTLVIGPDDVIWRAFCR